jgi:predicted PurR-regulated permease PerM
MTPGYKQLIQIALVVLLLIGCVAVLLPFTGTLLFAVVICITTLPMRNRLLTLCRGRSSLAALLVSMLLLLLLVAPMALLSGSLADGVEIAIRYFKPLMERGLPTDPPVWLARIPVFGSSVASYWQELVESREEMNNLLRQFLDPTRRLALAAVSLFAQGLLQLVLVIFFVFFIFRDAHIYADALHTGSRMLAGDLGERMLALVEGTVTGGDGGNRRDSGCPGGGGDDRLHYRWRSRHPHPDPRHVLLLAGAGDRCNADLGWGRHLAVQRRADRLGGIHGVVGHVRHQQRR